MTREPDAFRCLKLRGGLSPMNYDSLLESRTVTTGVALLKGP